MKNTSPALGRDGKCSRQFPVSLDVVLDHGVDHRSVTFSGHNFTIVLGWCGSTQNGCFVRNSGVAEFATCLSVEALGREGDENLCQNPSKGEGMSELNA